MSTSGDSDGSRWGALKRHFSGADRGQSNLVGLIIGVAVAAIVAIGVAIPIVNDVISSANVSGTTALIVGFIPVMLGLLVFVASASPIMRRV